MPNPILKKANGDEEDRYEEDEYDEEDNLKEMNDDEDQYEDG